MGANGRNRRDLEKSPGRAGCGEKLASGAVLLTRKRWDAIFVPAIALSFLLCVLFASKLGLYRPFTGVVLLIVLWLSVRFGTPRSGRVERRLSSDLRPPGIWFLLFHAMWVLIAFVAIFLASRFWNQLPQPLAVAAVALTAWCAVLFYTPHKADHAIRQRDRDAA
jgi:hypothetical protein